MSLILPSQISARKHVDAGVRSPDAFTKMVWGRVDTTTPTILNGSGFSVAKNATGDVTVTFSTTFDSIPAVVACADRGVGANGFAVYQSAAPTTTTARFVRATQAGAAEDGTLSFVAVAPVE